MALNKSQLKADIKDLVTDMKSIDDVDKALETFADRLSAIIDSYIKSAQVNPGIPVATSGSATSQVGQTTSTGSLS